MIHHSCFKLWCLLNPLWIWLSLHQALHMFDAIGVSAVENVQRLHVKLCGVIFHLERMFINDCNHIEQWKQPVHLQRC